MRHDLTFPLYRIKGIRSIERNPLGIIKVKNSRGEFILDNPNLQGDTLGARRLHILKKQRAKLGERLTYLRQLIKYPSGTYFIDNEGRLYSYKKGKRRYLVVCRKILKKTITQSGTIIHVEKVNSPFKLYHNLEAEDVKFASIMETDWGPFLYDITGIKHEPFRRAI